MAAGTARIVVVGAGFGGLAASIALASADCGVTLLDGAAAVGGKARGVEVGGVALDGGPTVLTMPWVFEALFDEAGASFGREVTLERASVIARHAWPDGARLDLHAERAASADAIGRAFGASEARAFLAHAADAARIYAAVEGPFLRAQRPGWADVARQVSKAGVSALTAIDPFRTMEQALARRFSERRLRQLFGRYATYCGSSPAEAPATLNLIGHVEAEGVHRVRGGIRALGEALASLARRLGAEVALGEPVARVIVAGGRARGVVTRDRAIESDAVVFAGDVSALGEGLLGPDAARAARPTPPRDRSLSAVTWVGTARPRGLELAHHNVLFSADPAAELDALGPGERVPGAPTVYVCAQDRRDDAAALGIERVLVLVNAPATGDDPAAWTPQEIERCERAAKAVMSACGLELTEASLATTTPADFHRLYPATGGALYGPASRGARSAFARHAAATRVPGLYVAGGSVHPGPGIPMAAQSGRLAAARLLSDLASTSRSRRAATDGTTSTP